PPHDLIREGRSRRHQACPICDQDDRQCIALPPERPVEVWCVRGAHYPGGVKRDFGFRSHLWYYQLDPATSQARPHPSQPLPPIYPPAEAGTMHRLLSSIARRFRLSALHQAKLAARGYDLADCGPEGRHVFASLPAEKAARVAVANWLLSDHYTR